MKALKPARIARGVSGLACAVVALWLALIAGDMFLHLVLARVHHRDTPVFLEGHELAAWQVYVFASAFAMIALGLAVAGLFLARSAISQDDPSS